MKRRWRLVLVPLTLTTNMFDGVGTAAPDMLPPEPPSILAPADGATVESNPPTVEGTAEAGARVLLLIDRLQVGTTRAGADGTWSITPDGPLSHATHSMRALAIDAAGNGSDSSPPSSFTILKLGYYGWGCSVAHSPPLAWLWIAVPLVLWAARPRFKARTLSAIACVLISTASGEALGQVNAPRSKNPLIRRIKRLYELGEYEKAIIRTRPALEWSGNGLEERVWLELMMGVLHVKLGDEDSNALSAYTRALELNPSAELPVKGPGRVKELFEQARNELAEKTKAKLAELPAPLLPLRPTGSPAGGLEPYSGRGFDIEVSARGEVEGLKRALALAIGAAIQNERFGAAVSVIVQPRPGLRAEGRFYPLKLGPMRPYIALGSSAFIPVMGVRAVAGVDLTFSRLRLFCDLAFEHFFNSDEAHEANALLLSAGAGWLF